SNKASQGTSTPLADRLPLSPSHKAQNCQESTELSELSPIAKPDRTIADNVVVEEFFEYDAEDFLVFLTLLITEGRTPECSVKGRTEGLHCPPAKSGDKFIEEKTLLLAVRSYVFFSQLSAWLSASHGIVPRNILYRISAADEECVCQFSQPPAEHLFPVPNVSQSVALRLRVQSLPRQPTYPTLACSIHTSLPLAPLYSKSPSLKPNLSPNLYSKTPSLNPGLNPNPNPPLYERSHNSKESHNRATLPFSGLPFPSPPSLPLPSKRGQDPPDSHGHSSQNGSDLPQVNKGQTSSPYHLPISPRPSPRPHRKLSSPLPLPPGGKAVRWLYALTSDPSDDITHTTEDYGMAVNGAESSKGRGSEAFRAFKTYSLAEPPRCPSPRASSSETNPLIGSLLQERQEVIARIAQRLNFCDPTAPHLPPALFTSDTPTKTPVRGSYLDNTTLRKTKDPKGALPTDRARSSPFDTPIGDVAAILRETLSPKPVACRRLRLTEDRDGETLRDRDALRDRQRERDSSLFPRPQILPQPQSSPLVIPRPLPQPQSQASPLLSPKSPRAKTSKSLHPTHPQEEPRPSSPKDNILRTIQTLTVTQTTTLTQTTAQTLTTKLTHTQTTALIQNHMKPLTQSHNQTQTESRTQPSQIQGSDRTQPSGLQDENQAPPGSKSSSPPSPATRPPSTEPNTVLRSPSPLRPYNSWRKRNRHSLDSTLTKAFHPCTGLPLLSSPVPQRRTQTGYFDLDSSLTSCKGLPWTAGKRVCVKTEEESEELQQLFSASAPPASLSLLGNFEECVLNYRLEPLGSVEGFTAETLFNPNKTVVKMFVVVYDLRAMPASYQTFLRQRTFSVPVRRDSTHSHKHGSPGNTHTHGSSRKALPLGQGRILRYLIHLRFQTSRSGKVYLHRDIRLLFSRKSMEVDSGAAYELKSYTESPADPAFSPRC
ncbi:unnamed protein product, partial [Coregonus sp. 'balchen']